MSVGWLARAALFPGIEESLASQQIRAGNERDAEKHELSDLILVPSEFVRRSVLALGGDPERIATVPYGIDKGWLDRVDAPVPGRVLFVGSVGLLKGGHYLAAASRILGDDTLLASSGGRALSSRGNSPPSVQWPHLCRPGAAVADPG